VGNVDGCGSGAPLFVTGRAWWCCDLPLSQCRVNPAADLCINLSCSRNVTACLPAWKGIVLFSRLGSVLSA